MGSKGLSLQIDSEAVTASDHVRVLGVTFSSDLSLDKHVSSMWASCFFWLRQLRRVRRSVDDESMKSLVHAFVTALVDYCNIVLTSSPRSVTNKLQRVLNAAVRLVIGSRKYDRGHANLHWLDVTDRVQYKLAVTVHRWLHNKAPLFLVDCCIPVTDVASRQRLRSTCRCLLHDHITPSTWHTRPSGILSRRTHWNLLPDQLKDSNCTESTFRQSLKTFFSQY